MNEQKSLVPHFVEAYDRYRTERRAIVAVWPIAAALPWMAPTV